MNLRLLPLLGVLGTLAAAGCAAPPADPTPTDSTAVCTRDTPTGSLMLVTRCRTPAEREQEQRETEQLRDALRNKATAPGKTGN